MFIWAVGEGFGGPYTAGSTDVGTGIVYALLFTTLRWSTALSRTPRWIPGVAAVVRGHLARLEHCFTAALRNAIRLGEVPAAVDPVSRAKGLVATSQGLMVIGKASPDEEVLRAIVDNAFAGLR